MSRRRNGLRKQVTEAIEWPLELRRKRETKTMQLEGRRGEKIQTCWGGGELPGEGRGWGKARAYLLERAALVSSSNSLFLVASGENPNRTSTSQVCPPTCDLHWFVGARGSSVIAAGPDISHGVTPSVVAASLGLELKHSWSLAVISRG